MTYVGATRAPAGKWAIAGTVVLGSFVAAMDVSIVNVAMPQMIGTFGVPLDAITWVAVAYSIAEIILVTMAAWFSALLGRQVTDLRLRRFDADHLVPVAEEASRADHPDVAHPEDDDLQRNIPSRLTPAHAPAGRKDA